MEELLVWKRFVAGEPGAFDVLYKKHWGSIFGLLYSRCHDRSLAEDLTQETFMILKAKSSTIREPDKGYAWLRTAALNGLRDRKRAQKRHISIDAAGVEPVDETAGPEERPLELEECIERLSVDKQDIFLSRRDDDSFQIFRVTEEEFSISNARTSYTRIRDEVYECMAMKFLEKNMDGGSAVIQRLFSGVELEVAMRWWRYRRQPRKGPLAIANEIIRRHVAGGAELQHLTDGKKKVLITKILRDAFIKISRKLGGY